VTIELALKGQRPDPEDEVADKEETMDAFKCGHCGRRFGSPEELQQHEKECVPARVK
jgi:hypothetical protein